MKLAVILYGQPRFWDLSWESIIRETTFEDSTTDYYFHFWDSVAYHSHDPEYQLTEEDKEKIVSIYKPKKYSFTDYTLLEEECKNIYEIVEKNTNKIEAFARRTPQNKFNLRKSIFEITEPEHLRYYLGQFVSLQQGANLIEEEYDYIFRIRTDVLFATPDFYQNIDEYTKDKQLFYDNIYKKEKGIFCKFGDLQIWEGARNISSESDEEENHVPKKTTNYSKFIFTNEKIIAKRRLDVKPVPKDETYNPKTQYLHMKDWYMLGSGKDMLQSMKYYLSTIRHMIDKSRVFIKRDGIDVNWSAGELVCGEVLGLLGINASELGYDDRNEMIIPNRVIKIANKYTKEFILKRRHIRVLADTDKSLKEQYRGIIQLQGTI